MISLSQAGNTVGMAQPKLQFERGSATQTKGMVAWCSMDGGMEASLSSRICARKEEEERRMKRPPEVSENTREPS